MERSHAGEGMLELAVAATYLNPTSLLAVGVPSLAHLSLLDIAVIAIYFVVVIWIGYYLQGARQHQRRVFMAGREMTAWIAGLSLCLRTWALWN